MKSRIYRRTMKCLTLLLMVMLPVQSPAFAQTIRSDRTTGTVISGSNAFAITEGTAQIGTDGTTLFHSFEIFSPASSSVTFDLRDSQNIVNTQAVSTIVGRVTGGTASFINGELSILQDSGTLAPDLFLINPYGVLFGENAQLSLPGSFFVSTAESVIFKNQATFSATRPSAAPLLTVSAPVGLQFGTQANAGITLQGKGHVIASANPIFAPYLPTAASGGLGVNLGESLTLIGGAIDIEGGVLSASGGRVNVGSVGAGTVGLNAQGIADYSAIQAFGDIALSRRSLIDVSGPLTGNIHLQGQNISLTDGSLIYSQNRGINPAGKISIKATEQLSITGTTPTVSAVSGIISSTLAAGDAGDIAVEAAWIRVAEGATLMSRSFSGGNSGALTLTADRIDVSGYVPIAPDVFSSVGTASFVAGVGGDILIKTQDLSVTQGGLLASSMLGSGQGGNVTITADTVTVSGTTPTLIASNIGAAAAGVSGNSGNINLQTHTLKIEDNGLISTSSINVGNAGDINIAASERIEIRGGRNLPGVPASTIASTVDVPPEGLRQLLNISGNPKGNAGSVRVATPQLAISDRGTITVANLGEGDAGQLKIEAGSIVLRTGGIDAFTTTGEGGSIDVTAQDFLLMRDESSINAISVSTGNGGNLTIYSPIIVGLGNSDIKASAVRGNGGNISLTTQGLFGLAPREQNTSGNDITASSEFGVNGNISVNGLALQANTGLVELSTEVSDPDTQVAKSCSESQANQFIASGRGGLPIAPIGNLSPPRPWTDIRSVEVNSSQTEHQPAPLTQTGQTQPLLTQPLTEASSWQINELAQVVLIHPPSSTAIDLVATNCL